MEIPEDWQTADKRYLVFEDADAIKGERIYRKKDVKPILMLTVIQ